MAPRPLLVNHICSVCFQVSVQSLMGNDELWNVAVMKRCVLFSCPSSCREPGLQLWTAVRLQSRDNSCLPSVWGCVKLLGEWLRLIVVFAVWQIQKKNSTSHQDPMDSAAHHLFFMVPPYHTIAPPLRKPSPLFVQLDFTLSSGSSYQ